MSHLVHIYNIHTISQNSGTSQNTLTKHTRLLWAHDVALGLDIVHSKNFVHRDLKTPNILFDATTLRAKIADFGLGKSLFSRRKKDQMPKHDDGDETKTSWSKCVMTGNAGSVLWMAPEVMSNFYGQGAEYGGSVDVYVVVILCRSLEFQENHSRMPTLECSSLEHQDSNTQIRVRYCVVGTRQSSSTLA